MVPSALSASAAPFPVFQGESPPHLGPHSQAKRNTYEVVTVKALKMYLCPKTLKISLKHLKSEENNVVIS